MRVNEIFSRLRRSVAFRVKHNFNQAISARYRRKILRATKRAAASGKPRAAFRLLYMTGRKQHEMLEQSLLSVASGWSEIPRLFLVSDGSITPSELTSTYAWWPNEVLAADWRDLADTAARRGRPELKEFAEKDIMGRKLCAVLESALVEETFYSDTDILWFSGPPERGTAREAGAFVRLAQDIQDVYDPEMLSVSLGEHIDLPWLNAGVSHAHGDIYSAADLVALVRAAGKSPRYFSEQTIIALACLKTGGGSWPLSDIHLNLDDAIRWPTASYRGQGWVARHYPGVARHQFWVDAFHLQRDRLQQAATS